MGRSKNVASPPQRDREYRNNNNKNDEIHEPGIGSLTGFKGGPFGKFFNLFWGWADYKPQDWSNAPYKRGYR
jgi:hypothetical protein